MLFPVTVCKVINYREKGYAISDHIYYSPFLTFRATILCVSTSLASSRPSVRTPSSHALTMNAAGMLEPLERDPAFETTKSDRIDIPGKCRPNSDHRDGDGPRRGRMFRPRKRGIEECSKRTRTWKLRAKGWVYRRDAFAQAAELFKQKHDCC